ncbi:MAG: ATP-dependent Lon protease, partial [Alteromonas naphthalenivorans]
DRMEIISLSSYTIPEKINIAKRHLVKRALEDTGLTGKGIEFSDEVLKELATNYTREAGVRGLERLLRKLCSKAARTLVEDKKSLLFMPENLEQHLGAKRPLDMDNDGKNQIGIVNGLAWTTMGGVMMKVESILMEGTGKVILTGQMGDVMKESATAALSYLRAHAKEFNIPKEKFTKHDLHIHMPEGAVPKDGPSGGVAIMTSILSVLTGRAVNSQYAMTGEINLRGNVTAIGGVKEKVLAAKRNKIKTVILPASNKGDLIECKGLEKDIDIIWVEHANEVLDQILMPQGA